MAFIVFEGIDGAGKSSLIEAFTQTLRQRKFDFISTREPGGTPLGEELRKILIRTTGDTPCSRTELLIYEAIRAQHVDHLILPALNEKKWVICDRFTASTLAFQGGGRKFPTEDIHWLNGFATNNLEPNLNVLLDLSLEAATKRRQKRDTESKSQPDRFENEKRDFHQRVREIYLQISKEDRQNWLVLDASHPVSELHLALVNELEKRKWL